MSVKLPIVRDVRVHRPSETVEAGVDWAPENSRSTSDLVTVMGFDRKDVLLRSSEVGCVQWRDSNGEIIALLVRIKKDIWGFSRRGDDDWSQVVAQYGNPDAPQDTAA